MKGILTVACIDALLVNRKGDIFKPCQQIQLKCSRGWYDILKNETWNNGIFKNILISSNSLKRNQLHCSKRATFRETADHGNAKIECMINLIWEVSMLLPRASENNCSAKIQCSLSMNQCLVLTCDLNEANSMANQIDVQNYSDSYHFKYNSRLKAVFPS